MKKLLKTLSLVCLVIFSAVTLCACTRNPAEAKEQVFTASNNRASITLTEEFKEVSNNAGESYFLKLASPKYTVAFIAASFSELSGGDFNAETKTAKDLAVYWLAGQDIQAQVHNSDYYNIAYFGFNIGPTELDHNTTAYHHFYAFRKTNTDFWMIEIKCEVANAKNMEDTFVEWAASLDIYY